MDSERSKTIVRLLHSATNNTQNYYGNDVKTAAQLLNHVLQYESRQAGFDLTAMRDAEFNEVEKDMFQGLPRLSETQSVELGALVAHCPPLVDSHWESNLIHHSSYLTLPPLLYY